MSEESTTADVPEDSQQVPEREIKPAEPQPMFPWPNSESIIREVLMIAQDQASEKLKLEYRDRGDDPLLSRDKAAALVPELEDTVSQAVRMYDFPDYLLSFLDEEVMETTKRVIGTIPTQEFNRLVEAASERLQEE